MSRKSTRTKVARSRHRDASAGTVGAKRAVLETADGIPGNRGNANNTDAPTCPGCGTALMTGIGKGWRSGICLQCPMCYLVCTSK
jgi:hypothetical protein